MQQSDLLPIGRLGTVYNNTGYISFKPLKFFRPALFSKKNFYLIFNSDRVFYVTLDKIKQYQGKLYLRFVEDGIIEELEVTKKALVLIEKQQYLEIENKNNSLLDFTVIFREQEIGTVQEIMEDSYQDRIIVELYDGKEVIIPDVEHFIAKKDSETKRLYTQNIEELLEL
jgi:ribosomal 30S subunit maturation factor RimM